MWQLVFLRVCPHPPPPPPLAPATRLFPVSLLAIDQRTDKTRARHLWQDEQGYWDPSHGVAFALAAFKVSPAKTAHLTRKEIATYRKVLVSAVGGDGGDTTDCEILGLTGREGAADKCPLTGYDAESFEWSMPPGLAEIAASIGPDRPPLPAVRIWVRCSRASSAAERDRPPPGEDSSRRRTLLRLSAPASLLPPHHADDALVRDSSARLGRMLPHLHRRAGRLRGSYRGQRHEVDIRAGAPPRADTGGGVYVGTGGVISKHFKTTATFGCLELEVSFITRTRLRGVQLLRQQLMLASMIIAVRSVPRALCGGGRVHANRRGIPHILRAFAGARSTLCEIGIQADMA